MEEKYKKLLYKGNWMLRASDNGAYWNGYKRKRKGAWNVAIGWIGIPTGAINDGFVGINAEYNSIGVIYGRSTLELCETAGEVVPIQIYNEILVEKYRVIAINEEIPLEFIRMCGYKTAEEGDVISPVYGDNWIIILDCTIKNQTGGSVYIYAGKQEIIGQKGGWWNAYDNSVQTITKQVEEFGQYYSEGNSKQIIK